MPACQSCHALQGLSSSEMKQDHLALVGIGELAGVRAVEHYHCSSCGLSIFRILAGAPNCRIWYTPDFRVYL
jgi:lipopolysaccharide biosynthesis regulator YciM